MKFTLTPFQVDASADVVRAISDAKRRWAEGKRLTAVSLSAPTGAGKTVMATAVIEELLFGGINGEARPDTTVMWVTDDPSLNIQTRRKMLLSSSQIRPNQLVTVDASLDQAALDRGKIYFVHIQQLSKSATNYVRTGNHRQWSLWDTIGNTISERGEEFLLIVDEAHRGTSGRSGGKTITARLMDGADGKFPPAPVVLGISATPQRFSDAIAKAGQRTFDPVVVNPEDVRDSGLIKDKLRIKHPTQSQPSDSTLIELAVKDLQNFDALWRTYSEEQSEPLVKPAMVIQVKAKVSERELADLLDTLKGAWGALDGKSIAHSFQSHAPLSLGSRTVRYVAPQDIQEDPHIRVVLFKEALTTGWDCPRAEVMVSLRSAKDATYIAQLIGRMVRTPLARRIATNDLLNSVALYLPYFDSNQVQNVVEGLRSEDSNITSAVEVESMICGRNSAVPAEVWEVAERLPTYTRPGKYHRSDVARLNALATLLAGTQLDEEAIAVARRHICDTLAREHARIKAPIESMVGELEKAEFGSITVDLVTGSSETETYRSARSARNVDDLFKKAKRTLGDSSAVWYWNYLCDNDVDPDEAKLTVAALAGDPTVPVALESSAKTLIDTWRKTHNSAIGKLPDAKRAQFYTIWQQSRAAEEISLILPTQITAQESDDRRRLHLYATPKKVFPIRAQSGWEKSVLDTELKSPTIRAWYRNPTGGTSAIAVPYTQSGVTRTTYPDFVFFHEADGAIVADIIDPHRPDASDTGPKWTGLAQFADRHSKDFRRVLAVIGDAEGNLLSLDLKNPEVAEKLASCHTETDIRKLFGEFGGAY